MAYNFVRASSHYITLPNPTFAGATATLSLWFRPASTPTAATFQVLWLSGRASGGSDDRNIMLDYRNAGFTGLNWNWVDAAGTGYIEYKYTRTFTNGTWYHLLCTRDTTTNPDTAALYEDGVSQSLSLTGSNNSDPYTTATSAQCELGRYGIDGASTHFLDGDLAEVGLWDVVLNAGEIEALSKGFQPSLIRPQSLLHYAPLTDAIDRMMGAATVSSATLTNHPPKIIAPRRRRFIYTPAAAPAGGDQPTMRRWGGVPGMGQGQSFGRSW